MDQKEFKPTDVKELGEFGLIQHLTENIKNHHPESLKGVGDDGAVIRNTGEVTVVSTDMLVEGIHFDVMYSPMKHLGYKAVVVNLSDIYAMNAKPLQQSFPWTGRPNSPCRDADDGRERFAVQIGDATKTAECRVSYQ